MKTAKVLFMIVSLLISAVIIPNTVHADIPSNRLPIKLYALSSGRITTYVEPNGRISGYIDGAVDLCEILQLRSDGWVLVSYPTGRTKKQAWAKVSDFVIDINFVAERIYVAKTTNVYCKSDLKSVFGETWVSDEIYKLGQTGNSVQILYNVGNYFKIGFINANAIKSQTAPVINNIQVFRQNDSRWGGTSYGYSDSNGKNPATISSAGCGILALTNSVYYLTKDFVDPNWIAPLVVEKGYRVNGVGTSHSMYSWFDKAYGNIFGIQLTGTISGFGNTLKQHIKNGGVAIISVPNHLLVIASYDSNSNKYLVLDSYPSSNRGTSNGYAWLSEGAFSSGSMKVSSAIMLAKRH